MEMEAVKKGVLQYILLVFGILLLTASPALFGGNGSPSIQPAAFLGTLRDMLADLAKPHELNYFVQSQTLSFPKVPENRTEVFHDVNTARPLFPQAMEPFLYSFSLLGGSLVLAVFLSAVCTLAVSRAAPFFKKNILRTALLLEALPDVFFMFSVQLLVVWIFKETGWQPAYPYYTEEDPIFLLPLLALTISPAIYLFRLQLLLMEEEAEKDYYWFAKAKGLPDRQISLRHLFRNTIMESVIHLPVLITLLLANLVVLEFVFNCQGLMSLIISDQPAAARTLLLILLITPFYLVIKCAAHYRNRFYAGKEPA
ncbi:ABC transporter permease subunit [Peribacillus sp. SCS-26]|uniref:ABC transporter permease subunit n=1 Tax=Paraperibacillus marinus TaxID=3115295 RepID=UPI0039063E11